MTIGFLGWIQDRSQPERIKVSRRAAPPAMAGPFAFSGKIAGRLNPPGPPRRLLLMSLPLMRPASLGVAACAAALVMAGAGAVLKAPRASGSADMRARRAIEQQQASRLMARSLAAIRDQRERLGLAIDPAIDPNRTGIIGDEFTPLTTSLGRGGREADVGQPGVRVRAGAVLPGGRPPARRRRRRRRQRIVSGAHPGDAVRGARARPRARRHLLGGLVDVRREPARVHVRRHAGAAARGRHPAVPDRGRLARRRPGRRRGRAVRRRRR